MTDFDVCIGCGDIPTNDFAEECLVSVFENSVETMQEMIDKGYIQDSCGHWYDPRNYIDSYYADW